MTEQLEISPRGTRGRRITGVFFQLLKPFARKFKVRAELLKG